MYASKYVLMWSVDFGINALVVARMGKCLTKGESRKFKFH